MKEIMMQLVNATNALIFILLVCNTYADEHEIHFAKIEKIPAAIKPDSGKIIAAIEYVDKIGHKAVVITEYEKGEYGEPGYRSEIFASEYLKEGTNWNRLWKIWDFAPNALSSVTYDSATLQIVDLDNDGSGETAFFYTIVFEGADPWILKYMLHKDGKKYAIRGTLPMSPDDTAQYEKHIDTAFNTLPPVYKEYSNSRWDKFAKEHFQKALGLSNLPIR